MTDQERLEEIKQKFIDSPDDDITWLISTVEEQAERLDNMAHVIKLKNKEMRELSNFLKERNIPLKELSPLITVMAHVERLEKENKWLDGGWDSEIKSRERIDIENAKLSVEFRRMQVENKHYREALEFYADRRYASRDGGEKARQALKE